MTFIEKLKTLTITQITLWLLSACSTQSSVTPQNCSQVQSIIRTDTAIDSKAEASNGGLLFTTHYKISDLDFQKPLPEEQETTQCNTVIELLSETPPMLRLWTASHCIKPLTLTSLTLAVRNSGSGAGEFFRWNIDHPILSKADKMREAYARFSGAGLVAQRERLYRAFDRRKMLIEGSSSVLSPRVSCENLRWSQQADERHSLCFSIFDLMHLDFELPDSNSEQSRWLLDEIKKVSISESTKSLIENKRDTFLRRIHTTSQAEWIIHEGNRVRQFMSSFPQTTFPFFSNDVFEIEKLNREVFSLPHSEEWSFMSPENHVTQDTIPIAQMNYNAINRGTYTSPRMTIEDVNVTCHRQLHRYNSDTNEVEVVPQLEVRPHEYCPGGAQFQPDHFWNRDRPWSWMMADMTVGAAQDYSRAIYEAFNESSLPAADLDRFEVASTFGLNNTLGFDNILAQLTTPLLMHLKIPITTVSESLYGFENIENTGAFLLSIPKSDSRVRFLKGDSGSIILLDGVPVATLYSVDGEETSGGASVLPLPALAEDDDVTPVDTASSSFPKDSIAQVSCR